MKFNKLIPELSVSNFKVSLNFYIEILGFKKEYIRGGGDEKNFAFLSYQGNQLMIDENDNNIHSPYYTGKLEYPNGRGVHFQIAVEDINPLIEALKNNNYPIKDQPKDRWFRKGNKLLGTKSFLVMDPDGYLIMFHRDIGTKPISTEE